MSVIRERDNNQLETTVEATIEPEAPPAASLGLTTLLMGLDVLSTLGVVLGLFMMQRQGGPGWWLFWIGVATCIVNLALAIWTDRCRRRQ